MANFVFNNVLAKFGSTISNLPGANDAIIFVPIETTGLEADATLRDYDDLSALLAGTSNEQTTAGRKTVTSITPTVDDTANNYTVDCADQVYSAVGASNAISAFVLGYDSDTTSGTDSNVIPITKHDVAWTPDGSTMTLGVANFASATS